MSAIFGLYYRNNKAVDPADLARMEKALSRHGVDGSGFLCRGPVGIGQCLMAFLPEDSQGRQPLSSDDGNILFVSDGRLDNREELIDKLGLISNLPTAASLSDGELMFRAHQYWGDRCVDFLVGVFAFAVWNARQEQFFIARSPITAPSLFYYITPHVFAFATSPKGLFALPFITRRIDEQTLALNLIKLSGNPGTTLYKDIVRLLTGSQLTASREGFTVKRYWDAALNREIRFNRDEEYTEALLELLHRVVTDNLRSKTPVGVMMSGGLDSTAVATIAARHLKPQGKTLATFTEVPGSFNPGHLSRNQYGDESPFVQAMYHLHDNLAVNLIRTEGQTFLDNTDALFFHLERHFSNTANRVWVEAILHESHHQGIRVLLTGMQGNLTVSRASAGHLSQLLASGRWMEGIKEASLMARRGSARSITRALAQGIMPLLPYPLWWIAQRLRGEPLAGVHQPWLSYSPIHPDFAKEHNVGEQARLWKYHYFSQPDRDGRRRNFDALMNQDVGVFDTAYRSMYGIDIRNPLADPRIAQFCCAIPEEQFRLNGESRSLIRRAMANRLPETILSNTKRGMQAADWFERLTMLRNQLPSELDRFSHCDLARRALDLPKMRFLVEHWPSGKANNRQLLLYRRVLEFGLMMGRFLCWIEN
ncbi:MAG TPA: asparagine synthetase B [Candidatus Brocadiaceae bacterium]|nr:asparagine synthetase B [Candidatus Brocadiaceae bacterium]